MKRYSLFLVTCVLFSAITTNGLLGQLQKNTPPATSPSPSDTTFSGIPNAFKTLDPRVTPLLSLWQVLEPRVLKYIYDYCSTINKKPEPRAKVFVQGEPVSATDPSKGHDLYEIRVGNVTLYQKELAEMKVAQGDLYALISKPLNEEGEAYDHNFERRSSVGGKVSSGFERRIGVGENNFRMPTSGKQYYSLSVFDQMLRVGDTKWWLQNTIGNDNTGYMFWYAGESKLTAMRPLIENSEPTTRKVIPTLLKLSGGIVYRLNDNVAEPNARLSDFLRRRSLNMGQDPKIAVSFEGILPPSSDQQLYPNVFGARINAEIPVQRINESVPISEPFSFSRLNFDESNGIGRAERLQLLASHPQFGENTQFVTNRTTGGIDVQTITPIMRTVAQASIFYTWWLERLDADGQPTDEPPDNIFRIDAGINYTEVVETALIQRTDPMNRTTSTYFATANNVTPSRGSVRGLLNYRPQSVLDWLFIKFEYRNETSYPFGFTLQYSNQIFMGTGYLPLFGNWLFLEAKYARVLRDLRPYESPDYFMISPVFRILIGR